MSPWLASVILGVNALAFLLMGIDKRFASKGARRVPEAHLLWPAALAGAPGAWAGMSVFRHKTQKTSFRVKMVLATLANAAWIWAWLRFGG